ncbi:unnamed protein product [Cercospora beticola]|nr:unnamed protein product [Cercospora beticola]
MKLLNLLTLATLTTAAALRGQVESCSSETEGANTTALLECMDDIRTRLEAKPLSNSFHGYRCADRVWRYAGPNQWQPIKHSLHMFKKCGPTMRQAAKSSRDWYQCVVTSFMGRRFIEWMPEGQKLVPEMEDCPLWGSDE